MMKKLNLLLVGALLLTYTLQAQEATAPESPTPTSQAQPLEEDPQVLLKRLGAQQEGQAKLEEHATLTIPEGFTFFPTHGAKTLMQSYGNLLSDREVGFITAPDDSWSVLFEFNPIGYVNDEDKANLNAEKMLKEMQAGEAAINEARKAQGFPAQKILGFAIPPKYNEVTQNLEWALRFTFEGGQHEIVNFNTKRLGRHGVMELTLICEPERLQSALPEFENLMQSFHFTSGNTYAEYRQGDRLASIGLTGLVMGGAGYAAAKTGFLAKIAAFFAKSAKGIIAAVIGVIYVVCKAFKKLFGKNKEEPLA